MKHNLPTVFVIFGATGDLMAKKIAPALFNLYTTQRLPRMLKIIGFARRNLSEEDFRKHITDVLQKQKDFEQKKEHLDSFLQHIFYQRGNFEELPSYKELATTLGKSDIAWNVCANKLFYLAVPPEYYKTIFDNLSTSGLTEPCSPEEGWTRILVEKPFGKDLQTAKELDTLLGTLFKEEQIYRIDHYLAKEMLQNILNFRFSNNLFESSWDNSLIESIHLKLYETMGVEHRGKFYDGVGALRDVGQNHLLQMLALIMMDNPRSTAPEKIRQKRAEILEHLPLMTDKEIKNFTYRAQYKGYRKVDGVKQNSKTETYFKIKTYINHPRFSQIPIIMESGKRMNEQIKEIVIVFKHPENCMCPPGEHYQNKIVIGIEPVETINIHFWNKKPGLENEIAPGVLNFYYRDVSERVQYVEEYEKLLLDCIHGNQVLFVSTREIEAMWRFTDPILLAWEKNIVPLDAYNPDTFEPVNNSQYIDEKPLAPYELDKKIGIIGMGKMGGNIAERLQERGWDVTGYLRNREKGESFEQKGISAVYSLKELAESLSKPRLIWVMLPEGKVLDEMLFGKEGIAQYLSKGDIVVDAGNSFYKNSIKRGKKFEKLGIHFVDVGVSGGPGGARTGACLMVGGSEQLYRKLTPLYIDIATQQGYEHFEGVGAGHFVKMVHNGIEYGMMQAIAEGFEVLKKSKYSLDLTKVSEIYNHGSVIQSRLMGWLNSAFQLYGQDLKDVSAVVNHTGEGAWTIETAESMNVKTKVIEESLNFRINSEKNPTFAGKVLTALRNQFGGHAIENSNSERAGQILSDKSQIKILNSKS